MGRVRKGRSSRDKGPPKGRGGASVTVAEQMSGEGSEQRSGPAEAILARRSSRPEMPGWLLKEGADEEDVNSTVSWPLRHRGRLACTWPLERRTAGCVLFVTCYLLLLGLGARGTV